MLCFPDTTFLESSESDSRELLAGLSRDANTPSSTRFSVKSSNHSGKSRNGSPCTGSVSFFLFLVSVESRNWSPSTGLLGLRRRIVAGLDVESSVESCSNDVLAVELEEPIERSGTTIGT